MDRVPPKPRKKDFILMGDFMRASAAWAERYMKEWPWGGPQDEDDDYYFEVVDKPSDQEN